MFICRFDFSYTEKVHDFIQGYPGNPIVDFAKPLLKDLEGYIVTKRGEITGQEPDELKRHYGIVISNNGFLTF